MKNKSCILIVIVITFGLIFSSTIAHAIDYNYLTGVINGNDAFYVQNEAGKQHFSDKSIAGEHIDPLTGNLILMQTDLVLPGKDGLDLRLDRYYSLSQAEFFSKSAGIVTGSANWLIPGGMWVVEMEAYDFGTNEEYKYYYPYVKRSDAVKRQNEIECRDTNNGWLQYTTTIVMYNDDTVVTLPYYYTSNTDILNYQRMRYNLGAGWAFAFPSVQLIRDNPENTNETPKGIYYHTGNGSVLTVNFDGNNYSFENFDGKDYVFDEDNPGNIGQLALIKYSCTLKDGTIYYFGEFGQLLVIKDNYDNKIIFDYTRETFYGRSDCRLIDRITDTVGREVKFSYPNDYVIDVTVTHPSTNEVLTMQYEKEMFNFVDENDNHITSEPVLLSFENCEGETTLYLPIKEYNESTYEEEYVFAKSIFFTFADKIFNAPLVNATTGPTETLIYLLGEVIYPHSFAHYEYEKTERNLGLSGITEAYRVSKRYDGELAYNVVTEEVSPGWEVDLKTFTYPYLDYTGYPDFPITYAITANEEVTSRETTSEKTIYRRYQYIGYEEALLLTSEEVTHNLYKEDQAKTTYNYSSFLAKQPRITETKKYDSNDNLLYTTYSDTYYFSLNNKKYGKIESQTKPLLYDDFYDSAIAQRNTVSYDYNPDNGKLAYKKWFKDDNNFYYERYYYNGQNRRLSEIISPENSTVNITYELMPNSKTVTKITLIYSNGNNDEKVEEYYTSDTNYAYPSEIRRYYTDDNGVQQYRVEFYTYDMLLGQVITEEDNDGNVTAYEYDNLGRVTKITYPEFLAYDNATDKTLSVTAKQEIEYDNVAVLCPGRYASSDYFVLTLGEYSELTYFNAEDEDEIFSKKYSENFYDGLGNIVQSATYDNVSGSNQRIKTINYYNDFGLVKKSVDALGNETQYYYDSKGRTIKTVDCYGNYYINQYDIPIGTPGYKSLHYFVAAENITGGAYNGTYNDADRENISETFYDIWGQATEKRSYKSYPNDYITESYFYDIAGNLTKYIDAKNNADSDGYTNVYSYDGQNRLTATKNAKGETITTVYDTKGNITKMYNNQQELFTKNYDEQGRLLSNVDTLSNEQTYQYNTLGLLETSIDRNGTLFNYYYDELGNTTNSIAIDGYGYEFRNQIISPHGPSTIWDIFYQPTANGYSGSIYGRIDNTHSIGGKLMEKVAQYGYDAGIDDIFTSYQGYLYDALGRVILSAAGNLDFINQEARFNATHNKYNKTRIEKVQINGQMALSESNSANVKYNFYPDGKLKSITFPPLAGGQILKSEYAYDGLGRLVTLTNTKGDTVISSYSYDYDDNGNVIKTTETLNGEDNITDYGYDALNRIETVKGTKGNNDSYSYDFRGNRKANYEETDLLTSENVSYSYDELNRLYHVNKNGVQTAFDYTADGYRFVKAIGNQTTFYVYDKDGRLNAEVKVVTDGTTHFLYPVAYYIWGPDRVLAKLDNLNGNSYYYIYNGHGDVIQLLDTAGNIVNTYDYDIWGNFITKDETIHNPFTYFCQTYDDSTGLYYLRARYYDPKLGRFTQEDPIRDGSNWYIYGNNNPVMFIDPSGESVWLTHGTFSNPNAAWPDDFQNYVSEQFNKEPVHTLAWSGENSNSAREEAAHNIAQQIIAWHNDNPNDPIRLVGHSHGGNISIIVANLLAKEGIGVETLITIATPVREYQLDTITSFGRPGSSPITNVKQHINVYDKNDAVQAHIGGRIWNLGQAGRTFKNAENVSVAYMVNPPIQDYISSHGSMHNDMQIWKTYIAPRLN